MCSIALPGWLVLALIGDDTPGWWVTGWNRWLPVIAAHLFTGLLIGLIVYVRDLRERAKEWVRA